MAELSLDDDDDEAELDSELEEPDPLSDVPDSLERALDAESFL
ncbi:MAG: hypothetical protein WC184_03920 [Acidimicrobiia bacterium]